jgi:regulatory protein
MARTSSGSTNERSRDRIGPAGPWGAAQAHALALRWMAGRDLTSAQLRERLARRGCAPETIDDVVDRLTGEQVVDDRRVALAAARTARDVKRHGPHRIARSLEQRGIPHDLARDVVAATFSEADEAALAERALARRLRGAADAAAELRRLHRYLSRQGFTESVIVSTLKAHATAARHADDKITA